MTEPPTTRELGAELKKLRTRSAKQRAALEATRIRLGEVQAAIEDAIVADLKTDRPIVDIARDAGYHRSRINQIANKHGIKRAVTTTEEN